MNDMINNKKNNLQKTKKMIFSFLYIFVLIVTTFHHHPIGLGSTPAVFSKTNTATSGLHFTAKECPIINFANNGFNSNIEPKIILELNSKTSQYIFPNLTFKYQNKSHTPISHRGPPLV